MVLSIIIIIFYMFSCIVDIIIIFYNVNSNMNCYQQILIRLLPTSVLV